MTQRGRGRWKCQAVDAEETQQQVSLSAHRPWKSLRDSHIPTAPTTSAFTSSERRPGRGRFAPAFRLILQ